MLNVGGDFPPAPIVDGRLCFHWGVTRGIGLLEPDHVISASQFPSLLIANVSTGGVALLPVGTRRVAGFTARLAFNNELGFYKI